ncbi:MAG: 2,4-dihydroxyhept-2-ene-1,7-dioic acid aldolase [Alphaproteobacteria bacterium]|nr:2,4-dihydroxyhept-2-ene-1,7-dioic acid aldolase [Alphaproteobacteria bacterium]
MENPVKRKLAAGEAAIGAFVTAPSAPLVQIMAAAGLDWVMIDLEHGLIDAASAHAMIAATAGTRCAPLVRVPLERHDLTEVVLDAGALGIVSPMVRTRAEAEQTVAALSYPPNGKRGWGPFYAAARWGLSRDEYFSAADSVLLNVVLIEHPEAVRNLDSILSVKRIDVAMIAPGDLSINLGYPNQRHHPEVAKVVAEAESKILKNGVALGGVALTPDEVAGAKQRGYRLILVGSEVTLVQRAIAGLLATPGNR